MGLFMDPIMDFIGLMFFMVIFLLIEIKPSVTSLRILSVTPPPCAAGIPYLYSIPVQGGLGDRAFSDPNNALADVGLSLDAKSGVIHGVPRAAEAPRIKQVLLTVKDASGRSASATLPFQVTAQALAVTPADTRVRLLAAQADLPPARKGAPYEGVIGASGGLGRVRWTASDLPPGLRMEDGRIVGTPKGAGEFTIEVKGEFHGGTASLEGRSLRWGGGSDSKKFRLRVLPPLAVPGKLPAARLKEAWLASVVASPLRPGESVTVTGLPAGIASSGDGLLTGTPERTGSHTLKVAVKAGGAEIVSGSPTMFVMADTQPEALPLDVPGRVGEALAAGIAYRGLAEPVTASSSDKLPEGLQWAGSVLRGAPKQPGRHELTVTLTDVFGKRATTRVAVVVLPPSRPFEIAVADQMQAVVGVKFSWPLRTTGGAAAGTVAVADDLPDGWTMKQGQLEGTTTAPAKWQVLLEATDPVTRQRVQKQVGVTSARAVSDDLKIATTALPKALVGDAYDVTLATTGAAGSVTWRAEGLPSWLKLEGDTLRGNADGEGTSRIQVVASDAAGRTTKAHALQVSAEAPERTQPAVRTQSLPKGVAGEAYAVDLSAQGGLGEYAWRLEGQRPSGLKLDGGWLHGTLAETDVGQFPLRVLVSDQRGTKSTPRDLVLEVVAPPRPPPPPVEPAAFAPTAGPVSLASLARQARQALPVVAIGAAFGSLVTLGMWGLSARRRRMRAQLPPRAN